MSSPTVPGALFGTVGSFLEDARRGTLPDGWLYRREPEDIRLGTPCIFVTDLDAPCDERGTPLVALEHGYRVESLGRQMIEDVVECARQFVDPPDAALMLESFVYFCRHDAFLPAPGAGPRPRGRRRSDAWIGNSTTASETSGPSRSADAQDAAGGRSPTASCAGCTTSR